MTNTIADIDVTRQTITVPDGRQIEFVTAGPVDAMPLVLHEGTPHGLVFLPPMVEAIIQRGLRYVLAARPGYEGWTGWPAWDRRMPKASPSPWPGIRSTPRA
jgi:hypothetical protein